jgi:hypothetical protein
MGGPSMEPKSESKLLEVISKLREQYPGESKKELAKRLAELVREDEALGLELAAYLVRNVENEMYDEYARDVRSIPEHLRKPS